MTLTYRTLAGAGLIATSLIGCAPPDSEGLDPRSPQVVGLAVAPDSARLVVADTIRFVAMAIHDDSSRGAATVSFSATGGAIDQAGLFRAGDTPGRFAVRAVTPNGQLEAQALVVIDGLPPPPPPGGPLGANADLQGRRLFPPDNPWNLPVDTAQVDPNSDAIINLIGSTKAFHPDFGANWNGGPFGIPYLVVAGSQAKVAVSFTYADESDAGPYPVPATAPIEGGPSSTGDRHVLVVDRDTWRLYELFSAYPQANGSWQAGSGAIFDLSSNALRPAGWTSADAAGLPILPGLVRYDEVAAGAIPHALRFTVSRTQRAYLYPARHWASSDASPLRPPMGMRVRLKSSFNISTFPASAQVILRALERYGMIVADNGSDWFVSGTADARWDDNALNSLKNLRGSDFEVIRMVGVVKP